MGEGAHLPEIIIPRPLQEHTAGQKRVTVEGATVGQALVALLGRYPALAEHVFTAEGTIRPSLHLFLGEREVHNLQGPETPLAATDRLIMVLPIGGGSGR